MTPGKGIYDPCGAYAPRLKTDELFLIPFAVDLKSEVLRAVRFVQSHQLLNRTLWDLFVQQFRTRPDGADRGWRGEYWGKMMRGACFTYRITGNEALYEMLTQAVSSLLEAADAHGCISSSEGDAQFDGWDMWCRKYVLLGLEYYADICRDEAFRAKVLKAACRELDIIIDHIGPEKGKKSILATSGWWGCMNSCSILEPVVRLYNITGEKRYLDFAAYIVSTGGSNLGNVLELAAENKVPPFRYPVVKAYETMSFFEGIAEYYRVTGEERLKTAFLNFTDAVLETDYTIIGSCGCTHELFDNSTLRQTEIPVEVAQETCVSVTLSKLLLQALCLTGDSRYAEAIERTWYNSILGSINFRSLARIGLDGSPSGDGSYLKSRDFRISIGGFTFDSYSPLYKSRRNRKCGGYKNMAGGTAYGCCACIGSAGTALLPLCAVMRRRDGLAILQYIPGVFHAAAPDGTPVTIAMDTRYPYDGRIAIRVCAERECRMSLMLRVPAGENFRGTIGGEALPAPDGKTVTLNRVFGKSTLILLETDLKAHTVLLNGRTAVEKGAIVYALDSRNADINTVAGASVTCEEPAPEDFDCRSSIDVTFDNGTRVRMTDYASAGSDWDRDDCFVTVWMDTIERDPELRRPE